jgi:hypothetical protein
MKKTGLVLIFALIAALLLSGAAGFSFAFPLPDTGQTKCYRAVDPYDEISCAGTGQDGAYSKLRSYTNNGSTVTDNVTGLEWQKCSAGQSGSDCSGGSAATYNWYQAFGEANAGYNPDGAINVCGALGADWRLPTKKELITLVNYGIPYPGPTINTAYFPNTESSGYWSSTTGAGYPGNAWLVDFHYGGVYYGYKYYGDYVRCVRGGQ